MVVVHGETTAGAQKQRRRPDSRKSVFVSHRSYGFHSPHALIVLIYLCGGGITIAPPHPMGRSSKRKAHERLQFPVGLVVQNGDAPAVSLRT